MDQLEKQTINLFPLISLLMLWGCLLSMFLVLLPKLVTLLLAILIVTTFLFLLIKELSKITIESDSIKLSTEQSLTHLTMSSSGVRQATLIYNSQGKLQDEYNNTIQERC